MSIFDHANTFSTPWRRSARHNGASALASRHRRLLARRLVCALCAGLLAWSIVSAIGMSQATCAIYVAARDITVGEHVTSSMLRTAWVPQDSAARHAISAQSVTDDKVSGFAQVAIARGEPIFKGMLSSDAFATEGLTSVDLQLASTTDRLVPGDVVDLVASRACSNADDSLSSGTDTASQGTETSQETEKPEDTADAADTADMTNTPPAGEASDLAARPPDSCILARGATVLKVTQPSSSAFSQTQSPSVALALAPADALTVLTVAGSEPIIAVERNHDAATH
ncbi:SAF domain-containing protein [Pseudoscardovia suis]|uniref:SAF domain containing protein n=1 Tax=Pseudoscardovia suis TaxID=987063 RepID=A0A261F363_9BIFI|nr:SAF domain-containing protein [Pseudoscardovia suis]OZG53513.1 SAF domain containing protein [Pseudoscardovia suis]PJJ68867.1 hypothetical protein CLV65_0779 [Pseudoscardovia suis]